MLVSGSVTQEFCCLGYCVARIRCISTIPASTVQQWFNEDTNPGTYFAYVDWFTPFSVSRMGEHHGMYRINYLSVQGELVGEGHRARHVACTSSFFFFFLTVCE